MYINAEICPSSLEQQTITTFCNKYNNLPRLQLHLQVSLYYIHLHIVLLINNQTTTTSNMSYLSVYLSTSEYR